ALAVLSSMPSKSQSPDVVSYNAAVNACEKGRTWERAIGLVQEMLRGGGVAPDIITFNSAISACEKAQQWEIALSLVAVLTSQGLSPDRVTFNAALSACSGG
ncbi:unnamed protein product, partial [Polarella glacialis]